MTVAIHHHGDAGFRPAADALLTTLRAGGLTAADQEGGLDVPAIVAGILQRVRSQGDAAVAALTRELDRAQLDEDSLRVPVEEIERAHHEADADFMALMRRVIANIREYQQHILVPEPPVLNRGGRKLGVRYTPIDRVAVYVPGGKALYPSTVLMTAVPALVAGVPEIVMASPPTGGDIHPLALALAGELGIHEVYRMGGAVACAALAYGTERIPAVQKIVGPGNAFVAEAKRQLFGVVGIDSIAGPSEVLIVADDSAEPAWVAADFLAQVEHNPGSAILVTPSAALAKATVRELEQQLDELERAEVIRSSLEAYSGIFVTANLAAACELANEFSTEHLQIVTADNAGCLERIRHAGAIFVGPHSPVPLGDYYAGPSHVLPTGGTAKFFGPLNSNDFRTAASLIEYDRAGLAQDGDGVIEFATREGLTAHANAIRVRTGKDKGKN